MNFLSFALSLFVFNTTTIFDCGSESVFSIVSQSFTPAHPKNGENVSWIIDYTVPEDVEISSARMLLSFMPNNFIPTSINEYNLCDEVDCPITSGDYSNTNLIEWSTKRDYYMMSVLTQWLDEYDNELLCSKVTIIS